MGHGRSGPLESLVTVSEERRVARYHDILASNVFMNLDTQVLTDHLLLLHANCSNVHPSVRTFLDVHYLHLSSECE